MTNKELKKSFEKKFVKPFQKNKDFNELQLGTIEIRDYLMSKWFEKALQDREKEIIDRLQKRIEYAESLLHGKLSLAFFKQVLFEMKRDF